MAAASGSRVRSKRRGAQALAGLLATLAFAAGLSGCSGSGATPSGEASAEPTRTKFVVTDGPTMAPTPTPTVRGLPNLSGSAPELDPDPPTCNVDFVIDFVVTNTGPGPTLGEARLMVAATRDSDGRIDLKAVMPNVPALAAGASATLTGTFQITRGGPHTLTMYIDSSLWVTETDEADNEISRPVAVQYGSCSS